MASSSYSLGFISLVVVLPFLLVSASATTYIDAICQHVKDKAFCVKTLNAYPKAASATTKLQAAAATLRLATSYADKSAAFTGKAAKQNPNLMKLFMECQDAFVTISRSLISATLELKESPDTANYDAMQCTDSTVMVKHLVGKKSDKASKTIIKMTLMMDKLLALAVGATVAVGG